MSSIQTVPVTNFAGAAVISSITIPSEVTQLIISNVGVEFYLALSVADLDNIYTRIAVPKGINMFRMDIPTGVGVLFVQGEISAPPVADSMVSFWLA